MSNKLTVTADLINDEVKFSAISRDNNNVFINAIQPLGEADGYTPLELFLMSLATCSGMTLVLLLRRMNKNVSGLNVSASGERKETLPKYFKSIHLKFELASNDVQADDIEKVIKNMEECACPIWNMVKNNVDISSEYKIE
jgi:putative redox protein